MIKHEDEIIIINLYTTKMQLMFVIFNLQVPNTSKACC